MADYATDIIRSLGAKKISPAALKLVRAWQRKEGGATNNSASFNWLNRTDTGFPKINKVGVVAYPDYTTGIQRTAELIRSGYPSIAQALVSGQVNLQDPAQQGDLNRWVSGKREPGATPYVRSVASFMGQDAGAAPPSGGGGATTAPAVSPMTMQNPNAGIQGTLAIINAFRAKQAGQTQSVLPLIGQLMQINQRMPAPVSPANTAGGAVPTSTPLMDTGAPAKGGYSVSGGIDVKDVNPALMNIAKQNGLTVTSGFRSNEKQAQLYAGRSHSGSVAKPGKSYHNHGRAIDIAPNAQGLAFLKYALAHPAEFREVFYDPAGISIKNGKIVDYTIGGHTDHIHVAV